MWAVLVRSLGMLDTMWALVLPTSASVWHIIIARTYFSSTVPQELVDAATMDGCSVFRFFTNIVLPLSKAIIAVLALYSIVGQWNQYFHALIYIYRHELMPLQMVLRDILLKSAQLERQGEMESQEAAQIAESIKYGSIIVSTLPVLVLYPFLQKYFVRGVMIGALKG